MKTKLFAPAVLAVALGFSSWSAGAASTYNEPATEVKTAPVNGSDMAAATFRTTGPEAAKYEDKSSGENGPNSRPASTDRTFKSGWGPAMMFQLRDAAGG